MSKNRVKYLNRNDMCYGMYLDKIKTLQIPDYETVSVNDAIEYYQIKRYFDDGARLKECSDEESVEYQEKAKALFSLTMRFFNSLNDESIVKAFSEVEREYISPFWEIFDLCKLYVKISDESFTALTRCEHILSEDLFKHKGIVTRYGSILREYIIENKRGVHILLHVYEQDYTKEIPKLFLPKELTGKDVIDRFEKYICGEQVNVGDLDTIIQMKCTSKFPVSDMVRYNAKQRKKKELERLTKNAFSLQRSVIFTFSPETKIPIQYLEGATKTQVIISTSWLMNTLDYAEIMENFVSVFEYVDEKQKRCTFVSTKSQLLIFERAFQKFQSNLYPFGNTFFRKETISLNLMAAYYDYLRNQGVRLEDALQWFFTKHLQDEYGCAAMVADFPSASSSYAAKCTLICTTMDSILKQYKAYVEYGEINYEALEMSSGSTKISDIPGLTNEKYIYGRGSTYEVLSYCLFSDQCMLAYVPRIAEYNAEYDSFIELLRNETVFVEDYREREKQLLSFLVDYNLISVSSKGEIAIGNVTKVAMLQDLYFNESISRWHYPEKEQNTFDELISEGIFEAKCSLFSEPEADYLSFMLNKEKYDNGRDLRNSYIHGVKQMNVDEQVHRDNYLDLLRIMVVIALKIEDDLAIHNAKKET